MSDETPTVLNEEVETKSTEEPQSVEAAEVVEEAPEPVEGEESETEEGEQEEPAPEEDVEYDLGGGQKLKVKANATAKEVFEQAQRAFKEVEGNVTRKFQEAAERTKSIEAREKVVEKLQSLNDDALNTYSRGLAVKQELAQLKEIDLSSMWQSQDPAVRDRARMVSDAISAKQAEFNGIVSTVHNLEGQMTQAQQAEAGRRMVEGKKEVTRHIPEFEAKVLPELSAYMVEQGLPQEETQNWPMNPLFTRIAHKAMLYDRMQAQATKAAKTPSKPKAAPVTPIKGKGGTAGKGPKDMSVSEMARHLGLGG